MVSTQFASFPQQLSNTEFSAIARTGGSTTKLGSINLHLSLLNRMGLNLLSNLIAVSWLAGEEVAVTIPANLIVAGEDVHRFILSGQKSGDETDAVQLADLLYKTEQNNGTVLTPQLPHEIILSTDDALETNNLYINDLTALPVNAIAGMIRYVDNLAGAAYRFDGADWVEHYYPDALTYIPNTKADRGCDRVLGNEVIVKPPRKTGDNDSVRVRYWLLNGDTEGGASLSAGYPLNLIVAVNDNYFRPQDNSFYGTIFNQLIKYQLVGYYRLINRSLNTGVIGAGLDVPWNFGNPLKLDTPLPAGYAAVIDVWLSYSLLDLQGTGVEAADRIAIAFEKGGELAGRLSPLSSAFGNNRIFGESDRAVVVPNQILSGSGIINGFEFNLPEAIALDSAVADTPNQSIYLDGSRGIGTARVTVRPSPSEVLRATVSTEAGFGQSSEASKAITLSVGQNLEITLRHPVVGNFATVRADYPDSLVAGNPKAKIQTSQNMLFLAVNGVLYQKDDLIPVNAQATQSVTVTSLAGWSQVNLVPDSSSIFGADFGLFRPSKPTIKGNGSNSALAAGQYQLWVLYQWVAPNTTYTRIEHQPSLSTFRTNFDKLNRLSKVYGETLTIEDARAINYQELESDRLYVIKLGGKRYIWYWNPTSSLVDNGETVLAVSTVQTGRLIRFAPQKQSFKKGSIAYAQPTLILGDGLSIDEDVTARTLTLTLDPNARINPDFVTSDQGDILVSDQGNILLSVF